jgi:hypothetical protein
MDVFEKLWQRVGCTYMSDMAHGAAYNTLARNSVKTMELEEYSLASLQDLQQYLTGRNAATSDKEQLVRSLRAGV